MLAGGVFAAGRWSAANPEVDTSAAAVLRTAHGPMVLVDGVPAGYARDRAGASAAAVNFLQVCYTASVGGVSPATIKTHFENIYVKYDVGDRVAAVAKAIREGILD